MATCRTLRSFTEEVLGWIECGLLTGLLMFFAKWFLEADDVTAGFGKAWGKNFLIYICFSS
jgi:hypothetical protein